MGEPPIPGMPPAPVDSLKPPEPEGQIASDVVGAMQKNPVPAKNPMGKLLLLIIIAAVVVIGGYLGATRLLSSSGTSATTTATPSVSTAVADLTNSTATNDTVRKQDLVKIQQALLNLYAAEKKYPVSATLSLLSGSDNILTKTLVPTYLSTLPVDPDPTKNYGYKSDGTTFTLTAVLDNTNDADATLENGVYLLKVTPDTKLDVTTAASASTATTSADTGLTGELPSTTN
jgi:hypothetical protein